MKIDLTGKTAVVTGSTQGIGRAIAAGLAESGAMNVVNGRTRESVDAAIARIRADVPDADLVGVVADVTVPEGVATMRGAVPEADILVNSVGIFEPDMESNQVASGRGRHGSIGIGDHRQALVTAPAVPNPE